MGLNEAKIRGSVADFIATAAGAASVQLLAFARLGGGTIQENYALDVSISGGSKDGQHALVMRTDAPSGVSASLTRAQEFAVLKTAFNAGVTVPEPLWFCEDVSVIGRDFYLMRRVPGTAIGAQLVRDVGLDNETLAERLGQELARLHTIKPPVNDLKFLPLPAESPALTRVSQYREYLAALTGPQPVLESSLRWLEQNAPVGNDPVLCHSDYRTGNYMVDGGRLTGILDWEFTSWSDPLEDIGWFCARCWRFGAWDREAGGIGSRTAFYRGYADVAGKTVDAKQVPYWEVMAAVRWAIIALQQTERHISGQQRSLELALTGRMVPEMELDMLMQIDRLDTGNQ